MCLEDPKHALRILACSLVWSALGSHGCDQNDFALDQQNPRVPFSRPLSGVTSHARRPRPPRGKLSGAPPARMTSRSSKIAGTAGAAWLALAAWCAPASAQGTPPLPATLPRAAVASAQTSPTAPEEKRSEKGQPV